MSEVQETTSLGLYLEQLGENIAEYEATYLLFSELKNVSFGVAMRKNISDVFYFLQPEIRLFWMNNNDLIAVYRKQWYKENKTFGYITQEIRLGGLKERMASVKLRLEDYLSGNIDRIEELEYEALPLNVNRNGEYIHFNKWRLNVGAGIV